MRNMTTILLALGFTIILSPAAHATDEFGSRFGDTAPAALEATSQAETVAATTPAADDAAAQELQQIAPAAGTETKAENITEENNAATGEIPEALPHKAPASTHDGYERDIENQNP